MSTHSGVARAVPASRRAARRRRELTTTLTFFAFMAPLLIGLLAFTVVPIIWGFLVSLSDAHGTVNVGHWVGLNNYRAVLSDGDFIQSLKVGLIFAVFIVPLTFAASLGLALLVNSVAHGRAFFRSVFFLPTACSYVIASLIWKLSIFNGVRFGIANMVLIHLPNLGPIHPSDPIPFTFGAPWVWLVLVTVRLWLQIGFYMIIFLAGLQEIPRHLYEAVYVDGARPGWTTFRHITFPLLRNTSVFVGVLLVLNAFQAFDEFFNINNTDPSIRPPLLYLFNAAITSQNYGIGAAGAFIVAFLIIAFTFVQLRLFGLGRSE
jgi:multiple sugar transport system permease protein